MKKLLRLSSIIFAISLIFIMASPALAYENHCWNCGEHISSNYCDRCPECGWYICRVCDACKSGCSLDFKHRGSSDSSSSSSSSSSNSSSSYSSGSSSGSSFPSASSSPSETAGKTAEELGVEYHEYDDPDYYGEEFTQEDKDKAMEEYWEKKLEEENSEYRDAKEYVEKKENGSSYDYDDDDEGGGIGKILFWVIGGLLAAFFVIVSLKDSRDLKNGKK